MRSRVSAKLFARDLRAGELNLLAIALCIAVGTVTMIALFADQFRRSIATESNSFLAADRVISGADEVPDSFVDSAAELGIDTAELLGFVSMIYFDDQNQLASVKAVSPGYPLRGEMRIEGASGEQVLASGQGHPAPGTAWIDRLIQARLGIELGDVIEVGVKPLKVTGIILSEPDPSSGFMDFAPRLTMNWQDIAETQVIAPGSQLAYRLLLRGEDDALESLRTLLLPEMQGRFRWRDVRDTGERLARVIDRAEGFIMLGGLLAVSLGGVAISLCAHRYAWRRAPQVAVLKTLGARPLELYAAYSLQFLLIGLAAVVVGWILGVGGHALLTELLDEAIPIALPNPSAQPLLIGALTGLVCLLAFALPSVNALCSVPPMAVIREDLSESVNARRTTVLVGAAAILGMLIWYTQSLVLTLVALVGTLLSVTAFGLLAVVLLKMGRQFGKRAGGMLRLALSNLSRHPLLNATHIGIFAMPICVLFMLLLLRNEVVGEWREMLPESAPNYFVMNIKEHEVEGVRQLLDENSTYQGLVFPMARGQFTQVNGVPGEARDAPLPSDPGPPDEGESVRPTESDERGGRGQRPRTRNFSASESLPEGNEITAGAWWNDPNAMEASLDEEYASWNRLDIGDEMAIDFSGREVKVKVTSFRRVDWDSFQPNFYILLSPAALAGVPSTFMGSFYIDSGDTAFIRTLLGQFPTLSVFSVEQVMIRFRDILDKLSRAMELLVALVLASAALVMLASTMASREVRLREYGLLRTLGGSSQLVRGSLLLEFAGLGLFAGFAAALATEATLYGLQKYVFEMQFAWHPELFFYAPVSGLIVVSLLGIFGTKRMMQITPVDILREIK